MTGLPVACSRPAALRLAMKCDLGEVRAAVNTVHEFLTGQGWSAENLMSFDLALVEACNNAVKYADDSGRRFPIEVEANCDGPRVEFRIHDHTPGFEWPRIFELPKPESESGRGLYLINSLMDHAEYFRGRGGNILVMRKLRLDGGGNGSLPPPTVQGDVAKKLADSERIISDMVQELSSCYESLSAIFRYSAGQSQTGGLKEFAQKLFDDLLQIISAEWFVLRLVPKNESRLAVYAASEPVLELEPLAFPAARQKKTPVEMEAALKCQPVWFGLDLEMRADDPLPRVKPGSAGLVYPILSGEQLVGTLALGKSFALQPVPLSGRSVFSVAQTHVVNMFVDFLAIRIADAQAREEQVGRRLVSHELEIARTIQRKLLPTRLPRLPGFTLAAFCRSAREVGGDFYDAIKIDETSVLLVIADVMGKGVPAAMFAAILRSLLRATPELTRQPSALLARVNRLLFPELSGVEMFITAQLACVDARTRKIVTANAGHCPLIIADPNGVKTFSPEGMPLGVLASTHFENESADLPENCRVLLYTDGMSDAMNANQNRFGHDGLADWLLQTTTARQTAQQIKGDLVQELDKQQSTTALNDDQTFLIMAG